MTKEDFKRLEVGDVIAYKNKICTVEKVADESNNFTSVYARSDDGAYTVPYTMATFLSGSLTPLYTKRAYEKGCEKLGEWFEDAMETDVEFIDFPSVMECGDMIVNTEDVYQLLLAELSYKYDKNTLQDLFIQWYHLSLRAKDANIGFCNIKSWMMGYYDTEDCKKRIKSIERIEELKQEMEDIINEETIPERGEDKGGY